MKSINMKFTRLVIIALLISFTQAYSQNSPAKSSARKMKIITFNIRYGTADDGENRWELRKDLFFELLKEEKADVIGLQEALKSQLDEIKAILPQYEIVGVGREDGKTQGEYSAILYHKNRFAADSTGYFWFSDTPKVPGSKSWGNNVTRICTWALLKDKVNKKSFYFYNLHIDHESQNSREKSAELLLKTIHPELPVIITGDFNSGEDNPAVKKILTTGYIDSFRKVHPDDTDVNTYHAFKGGVKGEKIDYIFISKTLKVFDSKIIRKNRDGHYPSDHFPVSAILGF
jgi:endonuclease/exonuclease/phosphatase family metal-dependent hydrolase